MNKDLYIEVTLKTITFKIIHNYNNGFAFLFTLPLTLFITI